MLNIAPLHKDLYSRVTFDSQTGINIKGAQKAIVANSYMNHTLTSRGTPIRNIRDHDPVYIIKNRQNSIE